MHKLTRLAARSAGLASALLAILAINSHCQAQAKTDETPKPNIVFILTDNLGYGELGCYGGGILRGAPTPRIDRLATQGVRFLNFNNEPMCTPSRSSILTGRFAVRTGTYQLAGRGIGLSQWERTTAELLSDIGYSTALYGKWHLGNTPGQLPIDQGFDDYYGIPNTSNEAFPSRRQTGTNGFAGGGTNGFGRGGTNGFSRGGTNRFAGGGGAGTGFRKVVLEGKKGGEVRVVKEYDLEARRQIDTEITDKTVDFITRNAKAHKPFYAYVALTQVHFPTLPSRKFEGSTGNGDWADVLAELDSNVGRILDTLQNLKIEKDTIFIFTSDNGSEDQYPWRGWSGPWSGSYFTAMEGGFRCPFIIRWPGHFPENKVNNELVHGVDLFTTLAKLTGAQIPTDRIIDGVDQSDLFLGKKETSSREFIPLYVGNTIYAAKYKNWKVHYYWQEFARDQAVKLTNPIVFNLYKNPQEHQELTGYGPWGRYPDYTEALEKEEAAALAQVNKLVAEHLKTFEQNPTNRISTPETNAPPAQNTNAAPSSR